MEWILWFQSQYLEKIHIRHVRSAESEKNITYAVQASRQLSCKVDGYFLDKQGMEHVMQFYGCWYHGCPRCFPCDRDTLCICRATGIEDDP